MAEVFAYGWATPVAAVVMSVSGCLLGIMLTTKALARSGRERLRLLVYASLAFGVTGIWQAQVISLLGLDVPGSIERYDPWGVAESLGVAVIAVAAGVFLLGYGRLRLWRMLAAGSLIGAGIVGGHYTGAAALRASGGIEHDALPLVASVAVATVAACAGVWFIVALRGLRAAFLSSIVMGVAICAVQITGMLAIRIRPGGGSAPPVLGINPIILVGVVALGAAFNVMIWYFTVGNSTLGDLHAIFEQPTSSIEIEPWMIEEVTARIAVDVCPVGLTAPHEMPMTGPTGRPLGPRPTPSITPVWRSMPTGGNSGTPAPNRWRETSRGPDRSRSGVMVGNPASPARGRVARPTVRSPVPGSTGGPERAPGLGNAPAQPPPTRGHNTR